MNNENEDELLELRRKKRIATIIMTISLIGLFSAGLYFNLFSKKINFKEAPETCLFFGFILLGVLGAFYTRLSMKASFISTLLIAGLFIILFFAGKFSRGEL